MHSVLDSDIIADMYCGLLRHHDLFCAKRGVIVVNKMRGSDAMPARKNSGEVSLCKRS